MVHVKYYTCVISMLISQYTVTTAEVNYDELDDTLPTSTVQHRNNVHNNAYTRQDITSGIGDNEDWATYRDRIINEGLSRLSNATSIEDVLSSGLLSANGRPLTAGDLSATYDPTTEKLLINGKGVLDVPDECSPREFSVTVNVPMLAADVILHPKCIKVQKCGGCCIMPDVVCEPLQTEKVIYNLMKLSVSREDTALHVVGVYPLEVIQHTRCGCRCSLSADLCGPLKIFDARLCSCRCNNATRQLRCRPPHFFNPESCGCECAERQKCCTPGDYCELTFNDRSCSCDVGKMAISANVNMPRNQSHLNSLNPQATVQENKQSEGILPHGTRTPSVASTTTETTDPCHGIYCPIQFDRRVTKDGFCVCTSRLRGGRRRDTIRD